MTLGRSHRVDGAALALADPARVVVSCDPIVQPGRDRYLRLLGSSALARIKLVGASGVEAAALNVQEVDMLFIDSSHERQATIDEWLVWRPQLAPGGLVIFHDYDHPEFPGVAQAIEHLRLVGRHQAGMFIWQVPHAT